MLLEVYKGKDYTEYVDSNAGYCPYCGNESLEYGDNEIDGEEVHFYYVCPKCGGAGSETYILDFYNNSIVIDN